jgi:hypothetical protein
MATALFAVAIADVSKSNSLLFRGFDLHSGLSICMLELDKEAVNGTEVAAVAIE